jgi:hypothetical protein
VKHIKDIAFVVALLGLAVFLAQLFFYNEPPARIDEPLKEGEASRIVVEDKKVTVLSKKGVKAAYVPSSGRVIISTEKDGDTTLTVKDKGFALQAGFGGVYADVPRLTLDVQFAYYRRFGFHLGAAGSNARPAITPYAAVSYRLDQLRLANTSVVVGMTTRKDPLIGIRVEL